MPNENTLPMVVTPAHSADDHRRPEEHPLLLDLWQGRKPTLWRSTPDPRPAVTYPDFVEHSGSPFHEQRSPPVVVRMVGMIQDMVGEVEYLRRQDDENGTYFERQAVIVVMDYDDVDVVAEADATPRSVKRPRRSLSSSSTTVGMYVYWHHDSDTPQNGLELHCIIEWIAVRDPLDENDQHETDNLLSRSSWMHQDGYNFYHQGWSTDDSSSPETRSTGTAQIVYWHAVTATPRTMDGLWLEQCLSPSSGFHHGPPASILFVAEYLNVSTTVATALWLTLLARAEPLPHSPATTSSSHHTAAGGDGSNTLIPMTPPTTLIGCTSLTFTLPSAVIPAWKHALQRLLQPALPLVVHVTNAMPPPQVVQQRHNGRLERQPWQYPPGTTIVWDQSAHDTFSSLLPQSFQIPLFCRGGHVCWLPADWRLLVLQPSSLCYHHSATTNPGTTTAAATSISLDGWTPTTATTTMPIPEDRHEQWASTLAALRENISSVTLDPALTSNVSRYVTAHRATARGAVTSSTWARWWTWTRLWARAHGRHTAVQSDWDQALALDAALGWS